MKTRQELIDFCMTFPATYEDYPFSDIKDIGIWTIMRHGANKKSFCQIYERHEKLCVNLKCDPLEADVLRQTYKDITPAYHMNKTHWNTVIIDGDVPKEELKRMIEHSYDLIKPKTKKRKLPKLTKIYELLYKRYGNLNWWPADSPFEVMVGAVLTQNTAWSNVEMAIANFAKFNKLLTPKLIENIPIEELSEIIRPAGFFNQKAVYLKAVTEWFSKYDYNIETVKRGNLEYLRKELLAVKGVGKETADSILLYAFNFPTFVIDAYTRRLLERLGFENIPKEYDNVKAMFETALPLDVTLWNNYHACIVINAKEHCKAKPTCTNCPLIGVCGHSALVNLEG